MGAEGQDQEGMRKRTGWLLRRKAVWSRRTWGKDRAGQGWSTGGRAGGKEVARQVTLRDGCRVAPAHMQNDMFLISAQMDSSPDAEKRKTY